MIALMLAFQVAVATPPPRFEREVVFTPEVRAYLNEQWDDVRPNQVERLYCLITMPTARITAPTDTMDLVVGAFRGIAEEATPNRVKSWCGPKMARLHIHTPTTCDDTTFLCIVGGNLAYLCFPSWNDVLNLRALEHRFGVIQCDRDGFVTFYGAPGAGGVP